jgi:uncharacterized membrane protein HdeD (DUF308 family)
MPDTKSLRNWERDAWWATLVGVVSLLLGYMTTAFTSWGALAVLVGQVLLSAGIIGFLAYGWYAGLASSSR